MGILVMGTDYLTVLGDAVKGRPCTAVRGTGAPCGGFSGPGLDRCPLHGGRIPAVRQKAADRLKEVRDVALRELQSAIEGGEVDPKVILDAVVKLTETAEALEGRSLNRVDVQVSQGRQNLSATIGRVRDELAVQREKRQIEG